MSCGAGTTRNYFPAVEKAWWRLWKKGFGRIPGNQRQAPILYDGSYHSVDSSEMSFKLAARLAFRKGMESAKPVLLEPIYNVEVEVPEANMGDIIGDLNSLARPGDGHGTGRQKAGYQSAGAPGRDGQIHHRPEIDDSRGAANSAWSFPTTKRCRLKMPRRSSKRPDVKGEEMEK